MIDEKGLAEMQAAWQQFADQSHAGVAGLELFHVHQQVLDLMPAVDIYNVLNLNADNTEKRGGHQWVYRSP